MNEDPIENAPVFREFRLWRNSFMISVVLFFLLSIYLFFRFNEYDIYIANKAFAHVAILMIIFSFALSGLCYFIKKIENKIVYRRYFGITGFYYGLVHGLFSLYTYFFNKAAPMPTYNFFKSWTLFGLKISNVIAFLFGLGALIYFLFMTLISNEKGQRKFKQKWRILLRIGYIAIFFVLIHFTLKKSGWWAGWFSNLKLAFTLPPLSLLVMIILFLVIILRIALHFSVKFKTKKE